MGVILINHNMRNVFETADRIHVQRLGGRAALISRQTHSMQDAVAIMTGAMTVPRPNSACGDTPDRPNALDDRRGLPAHPEGSAAVDHAIVHAKAEGARLVVVNTARGGDY